MRRIVLAVAFALSSACSAFTSTDGIFGEGSSDATEDGTVADGDDLGDGGMLFPTEDGSMPPPPCGAEGEACCDMPQCNAGLVCGGDKKCAKQPPCGADGQPCCGGSACNSGLECKADKTCGTAAAPPPCGSNGEGCCMGGACVAGLACNGSACVPCGASGQPCCGGTCSSGLACNGPSCVPCGGNGQPCCIGAGCSSPNGSWCGPAGCTPLCYLRCCDGSLQVAKVTSETDCRNAYPLCADKGKVLRIQYDGTYIYVRSTACP